MTVLSIVLSALSKRELSFNSSPIDGQKLTKIEVGFRSDDGAINTNLFVDEDRQSLALFTYLMDYEVSRERLPKVLSVINELNYRSGLWGHLEYDPERNLIRVVSFLPFSNLGVVEVDIETFIGVHWDISHVLLMGIPQVVGGTASIDSFFSEGEEG